VQNWIQTFKFGVIEEDAEDGEQQHNGYTKSTAEHEGT
jgi:hypothetical protein